MSERFKITEEEISQTLMHSPLALPNSPSQMGLGAGQIKKYFYDFIRQLSDRINIHLSDIGVDMEATEEKATEANELAKSAFELASGKSRVHIVGNTVLLFEQLLKGEMEVLRGDFIFVTEKGVPDFIVFSAEGEAFHNPVLVTLENAATIKPQVGQAYITEQNHIILIGIETGLDTSVFATQGMLSETAVSLRRDLASKEELLALAAEKVFNPESDKAQSGQAIDKFFFESGKNLYNPENNTVGKRADESGQETTLIRSEWIPVIPSTDYVLSNQTGTAYSFNVAEKNSAGTVKTLFASIRLQDVPNNYNALPYQKITTSSDAAFIRFSAYVSSANPAMEKEMMLEVGSEMTEYEAYKRYIKPSLLDGEGISDSSELEGRVDALGDEMAGVTESVSLLDSFFLRGKNLYNPEKDTFGARADGTNINANARNSEWIAVEPSSSYMLSNNSTGSFAVVIVLKENESTTVVESAYTIAPGSAYLITTTEATTHIKFSTYSSGSNNFMAQGFMLEAGTEKTEYEPYGIMLDYKSRLPLQMQNPWMGKKIVVDGDSITHDWEGTYWQFVASKILGMRIDTSVKSADDYPEDGVFGCGWRGIGGSTIADETQAKINAGQTTDENPLERSILLRHGNLPSDADLVMIAGGSNDWAHSMIDLGETDSTDTTTFNGALNTLLPSLKTKYPTVPIVMMTPIKRGTVHNSTNNKGYTLEQFANALIAKCREYGVYCLDMWGTCPVNPQIPVMLEMYFRENDSTHPNNAGQEVMGKTVAGFLKAIQP